MADKKHLPIPELLARLERLAATRAELLASLKAVVAQRDRLAVTLYRRGVSLRVIARAGGLHYTRIRQLVAEAERKGGYRPVERLYAPIKTHPARSRPRRRRGTLRAHRGRVGGSRAWRGAPDRAYVLPLRCRVGLEREGRFL